MSENATIQLPKDLVEGVIKNQVAEAMTRAMGGHEDVVSRLVGAMLSQKVDREGRPSSYSSDISFIQWCLNECLRKAIKSALEVELVNHEADIRQAIVDDLKKKNSPLMKNFVSAMTKGVVEAASNKWTLNVEVRSSN